MEMNLNKYRQLVNTVENSDWFQKAVTNDIFVKQYLPYANIHANCLGKFSNDGFKFSCEEFAVTFATKVQRHKETKKYSIDKASSLVSPSSVRRGDFVAIPIKQWYLINHITDRNRMTWRIMNIIWKKQKYYIQSSDPLQLELLPYSDILREYKKSYPKYYCDSSIISRIVKNKKVKLPKGDRVELSELLPKKSYLLGLKIQAIIQNEQKPFSDLAIREKSVLSQIN